MGDLGIGLVSSLLRTLASSLILFHGSGSKLSSFSLSLGYPEVVLDMVMELILLSDGRFSLIW